MANESLSERYKRLKAERENSAYSSTSERYNNLRKQKESEGIYNDITALNPMLQNATSSWQNAETMASTKNSLADTLKRMNSYKSAYGTSMDEAYAKSFDDTLNGYQELFDNWDALSAHYSQAKDAESYNNWLKLQQEEYERQNANVFDNYKQYMSNADFAEKSALNMNDGMKKYFHVDDIEKMRDADTVKKATAWNTPNAKYGYMTDDERNTYYYLLNTDRAEAQKFLNELDKDLNKRRAEKDAEFYRDYGDNFENVAKNPVIATLAGLGNNFFGGIMSTVGDAVNKLAGGEYDANAWWHGLSNRANANMQGAMSNMNTGGGQFAYSTAMSMANSALNVFLLGNKLSLANMGMQAYSSTAKDLYDAGASEGRIVAGATFAGVLEAVTEMIGVDNWFRPKAIKSATDIVKTILKQAGAEGTEEIISEIGNQLFDLVAGKAGSYSDIEKRINEYKALGYSDAEANMQVIKECINDVVMAGAGGALSGMFFGGIDSARQWQGLVDTGTSFSQNGDVEALKGIANDLGLDTSRLDKKVTPAKVGATVNEVVDTAVKQNNTDALNKLSYEANKNAVIDLATGKNVDVKGLTLDGNNIKLQTSNGDLNLDEVLVSGMESAIDLDTIEDKQAFVDNYKGGSLGSYYYAFQQAYNRAFFNDTESSIDTFLKSTLASNVLSAETLSNIYRAGVKAKISPEVAQLNEAIRKFGNVSGKQIKFSDDFSLRGNSKGKINFSSLSEETQEQVAYTHAFASAINANVRWFDSETATDALHKTSDGYYERGTNTIWLDVHSEKPIIVTFSHELTHWMQNKNAELYRSLQDSVLDFQSSKQNISVQDLIFNEASKLANRRKLTKEQFEEDYSELTQEATDEIVARSCEEMLQNSQYAKDLLSNMAPNTRASFAQTVKKFIDKVLADLKAFFDKFKSNSKEAVLLRESIKDVETISKKWDALLKESIEVTRAIDAYVAEHGGKGKVFAMKDSLERTNNLIAIHNLREDNLIKTLELGGFPMPSIAIMLAENAGSNNKFGEISVVFGKETIDPKVTKDNNVYSSDAYTQTFPTVDYKINKEVQSSIDSKIFDLIGREAYSALRGDFDYSTMTDAVGRRDTLAQYFGEKPAMKYAYLKDIGKGYNLPYTEKTYGNDEEENKEIFTVLEYLTNHGYDFSSHDSEEVRKYFGDLRNVLNAWWKVEVPKFDTDMYDEDDFAEIDNVVYKAERMKADINKFGSIPKTIDYFKAEDELKELVKNDDENYVKWLDNLFDGVIEKKGIRNDKDIFTASGSRRSWDSLHYEFNLENVVKVMKGLRKKGVSAFGGNFIGASTKQFNSIPELKKYKGNLKTLSTEEYKEIKDGFEKRFKKIASEYQKGDYIGAYTSSANALCEAVALSNSFESLNRHMKADAEWYNYSEELAKETWELVTDIWNMPTGYFEAKPARVVGFDEIQYVVAPTSISESTKSKLTDMGIKIEYYTPDDDVNRLEAINSHPEVRFSPKKENTWKSLSSDDLELFERKIASVGRIENQPKSRDGKDYILQINNKLVYTDADIEYPQISMVVEFNVEGETDDTINSIMRGAWIKYEQSQDNKRLLYSEYARHLLDNIYSGKGKEANITLHNRHNSVAYERDGRASRVQLHKSVKGNTGNRKERSGNITEVRRSSKDSNGTELTRAQIDYFKDSVVRDANGNLLVMYHGTPAYDEITKFKKGKNGYLGAGMYFTNDKSYAKRYADSYGEGTIYEVYLDVKNPLVVTDILNVGKEILNKIYGSDKVYNNRIQKQENATRLITNADLKKLATMGYDGILWRTGRNDYEVSVWEPNAIKRTDNFNPTASADIRFSVKDSDRVFVTRGVEVVQNPTDSEYRQMREEILEVYPWLRGTDEPLLRQTYDEEGNVYYWDASKAMHYLIEPEINKRYKTRTSQHWKWWESEYKDEIPIDYESRYSPKIYEASTPEEADKVLADLYEENKELKRLLQIEKEITDEVIIDETKLDDFVNEVYDYYRADKADKEGFKRTLRNMYSDVKSDADFSYDDFKSQAKSLAEIVINSSPRNDIDDYAKQMQEKLKSYFKGVKLKLNENQKKDLESASGTNWHKALFGRVNTANSGQSLDQFFNEMLDNIPELNEYVLSSGIELSEVSDADQAVALWELVNYFYSEQYVEWSPAMVRSATTDLANRIIDNLWNITPTERLAEKYDAKVNNLNKEYKKKLDAIKKKISSFTEEQYKAKYQKQYDEMKQRYDNELNAMQGAKDRLISEIAELKNKKDAKVSREEKDELRKQYRDRFNEMYKRKVYRDTIQKKVDKLSSLLIKNDSELHCPEAIKAPLGRVLRTIDFTSGRAELTQKDVNAIVQYRKLKEALETAMKQNETMEDEYFDFSEEFIADMQDVIDTLDRLADKYNEDVNIIRLLDSERLKELNNVLSAITHSIYQTEKSLNYEKRKKAIARGASTINYLMPFGDRAVKRTFGNWVDEHLHWNNILPAYMFDRFGAGGQDIFKEFVQANDKYAFLIGDIEEAVAGMYTEREASQWYREVKEITVDGNTYKMTVAQIMNLYELSKREGAKQHLYKDYVNHDGEIGSFKVEGEGMVIGAIDGVSNPTVKIKLDEKAVKAITNELTDRQKEVADKMQNFLATTCAKWGNYVSMHRWGILQFTEDAYMPMQVYREGANLKNQLESAKIFALLNRGFTKSLNEKANGALVIDDIFSVFAKHAQDMAVLNCFGMPVLDMYSWMSFKEVVTDAEGNKRTLSVKQESDRIYGTIAMKALNDYLEDLNGINMKPKGAEKIGRLLLKNYKASAVAGNLRVALMQPVAIIRATKYIDSKYIREALLTGRKELAEVGKRQNAYSGISKWKNELGQFDNAVSKELTAEITKTDNKFMKGYEKFIDWTMKPAGLMDEITWRYLYKACELETESNTKLEGEALNEVVAERFADIVTRTQVVNTMNTRSLNMKDKSWYMQILTAFMSEPTVSYSMLESDWFNYELDKRTMGAKLAFKKHGREMLSSFMAVALTAFCTSIIASFPDMWRDGVDDDKPIQQYLKTVFENLAQEMTSFEPFSKEVSNMLISGYSASRSELAFLDSFQKAYKSLADGKFNYSDVYRILKFTSQFTGAPLSNIMREVQVMWDNTIGEAYPSLRLQDKR